MPTVSFEDLQVYQLAETLADDVWGIVMAWDAFARDRDTTLAQASLQAKALERRTDRHAETHNSGSFTEAESVSSFNRPLSAKTSDQ